MINLYEKYKKGDFEKVGTKKLTWQGRNEKFDIIKINIDELRYNVLNGRIAELDLDNGVKLNEATYKDIKDSIVNSSRKDIEKLGRDIGKSKLKEPLIINKEGIIVDGNRRYTAINMILNGEIKPFTPSDVTDLEFVEAVILNADSTNKSVKMLEYSIQFDDMKKPYDPISRAFDFARSNKVSKISIDEISISTGIKKTEIEKDIRTVTLIRVYLAAINAKDNISLAIDLKLDGPFKEIASSIEKTEYFKQNQKELVNIITIAKKQGGDVTRVVRDLVKGVGAGKNKENITNSPRVKKVVKDIVKKNDIENTILKAATAETNFEKIKVLSASKEINSNKIYREINNLKTDLMEEQILFKASSKIIDFKSFIMDLDWGKISDSDKSNLNKISEVIYENK